MISEQTPQLHLSASPHIRKPRSVPHIMRDVVFALIPSMIAGVVIFGFRAVIILACSVLSALITEYLISVKLMKQRSALGNWSAAVTGILLGLTLPVSVPAVVPIIGAAFSIAIVKWAFGGLGNNFMNPALAGRAFLMVSFPAFMTGSAFAEGGFLGKVPAPLSGFALPNVDTISGATPLAALPELIKNSVDLQSGIVPLLLGNVGGSIGETSVIAILIGALYLLIKRVIRLTIPVTFIGTLFILMLTYYGCQTGSLFSYESSMASLFHTLSGGVLFAAFFMATDTVTSPITAKGQFIFAIGCALLTFLFRIYGHYPEGVGFAIILMNLLTPFIDRSIAPRVFGTEKR